MLPDDSKKPSREELEALRKKIDPAILQRVANSMGAGGAVPPASGGSSSRTTQSASDAQKEELRRRTQRSERAFKSGAQAKDPPKSEAFFVIYDSQTLRARNIQSYLSRAGFTDSILCQDEKTTLEKIASGLKNDRKKRVVVAVSLDMYQQFYHLLTSDETAAIRKNVPKLESVNFFVFIEPDTPPLPPGLLDAKYTIRLEHNEAFSGKRIRAALGIVTEKPGEKK